MNISPFALAGAYWDQLDLEARAAILERAGHQQPGMAASFQFSDLFPGVQYSVTQVIFLGAPTEYHGIQL